VQKNLFVYLIYLEGKKKKAFSKLTQSKKQTYFCKNKIPHKL